MNLFKKLFTNAHQQILSALAAFISLLVPAIPIIITAFVFILADAFYGYRVSKKYGYKIESKKLWATIHKLVEAGTVIILALLLDKYLLMTYEQLSAVKVAAGVVCTAETISLLESFRALHPNALMSKILAKIIKSKAEKYLDVDLSDIIDLNELTNDCDNNSTKKQSV